jgi:hypothetical protein
MDEKKLAKLEDAGWVAVSVQDFLGLTDVEAESVNAVAKASAEQSISPDISRARGHRSSGP